MRVEEIKRLVALVEESKIDELEVRRWWSTVRIARVRRSNGQSAAQVIESPVGAATPPPAPPPPDPAPAPADEGLAPVLSPMVGTFYRASSPTSPPYVEVGDSVKAGQVVCIIEAMKLMNEIESEVAGTVVEILAKNEQPVEFNQPLFKIRPQT